MSLSDEYLHLKTDYRKIFFNCVEKIEASLAHGESLEDLEKRYLNTWHDDLDRIAEFRRRCSCGGCGACCKFAVSEFSPEELRLKAENGDNFAQQFVSVFVPYESVESVKEIYPEYVEFLQNSADGNYYFYHCPKVTEDNKCPDYENRPQICRDFPDNPLAFLPKSCTFIPWKLKSQPVCLKLNAEKEIINFYNKGTF